MPPPAHLEQLAICLVSETAHESSGTRFHSHEHEFAERIRAAAHVHVLEPAPKMRTPRIFPEHLAGITVLQAVARGPWVKIPALRNGRARRCAQRAAAGLPESAVPGVARMFPGQGMGNLVQNRIANPLGLGKQMRLRKVARQGDAAAAHAAATQSLDGTVPAEFPCCQPANVQTSPRICLNIGHVLPGCGERQGGGNRRESAIETLQRAHFGGRLNSLAGSGKAASQQVAKCGW